VQLTELGERLVALHGQHAHQSLATPRRSARSSMASAASRRSRVRSATPGARGARPSSGATRQPGAAAATAAERERLDERARELAALGVSEDEWSTLNGAQSRLANAAALIEAAEGGEAALPRTTTR
jgi:DNA repair protein RecN (Recombination protein N)